MVFVVVVGIAFAAVPRAELLRTIHDAERRIAILFDDFGPAAEKVADDAMRMFTEVRDRMERVRRKVFSSDDERRDVAERRTIKVFRPNLTGRARILDADTLDIGRTRVRLHGIDAPENRQSCIPAVPVPTRKVVGASASAGIAMATRSPLFPPTTRGRRDDRRAACGRRPSGLDSQDDVEANA